MDNEKDDMKKTDEDKDKEAHEDINTKIELELEKTENNIVDEEIVENQIKDENNKDETNLNKDTKENLLKKINEKRNLCICILVLLVIIFSVIIKATVSKYDNVVYPGAYIYKVDISNLNKDQLLKKLVEIKSEIGDREIQIMAKDKTHKLKINKLAKDYNESELAQKILNEYNNKNIIQKFISIISKKEKLYAFNIDINDKFLGEEINTISTKTNLKSEEPKVIIDNENITIKDGKKGFKLDEKTLIKDIVMSLNSADVYKNDISIKVKYIDDNPTIDTKELSKVNHKISTYTTTYSPGGGRGSNVATAAKKIDDILLMPGDEFSYEDVVGPVTQDNGYTYAPVISNGELIQGIGGGVCQVSSTLYNTQLKAGILPTERRNHSKPVSYVPRGLDATLATGSIDYKFKNTHKYPIVINTHTGGGRLTIEFWSNEKALEGIDYKPVGYVSGNVANTYLYGYNKDGKKIYEKHIDTSVYR